VPIWLLWMLPSYEAGFWSALLAAKLRNRGKVRELLVYGKRPRTSLPLIDEWLRKGAGVPTRTQALTVKCGAAGIRWFANTKALEHLLLILLKGSWFGGRAISKEVNLCL